MSDFHPETYKLDEKSDRELFLDVYKGDYDFFYYLTFIT